MGVLDELKQEAQAIEAENARESTTRAAALAQVRRQIEPCMRTAYKYFNELKQHLEVVGRDISASYDIRGAGHVDGLMQSKYGVSTDNPEQIDKFSFRFVCAKNGAIQVHQRDSASANSYREYLKFNGMQAKVRDSTTGKGAVIFMVQPAVPVVVEFSADYDQGKLNLRVRNLTSIGVARSSLTAEQVDEKFLDEVAKAVLRQPNRFDEVSGNSISNTSKLRLKEKIQIAMRQKELADKKAQEVVEERTLTKRLANTLFGRKK